MKYPPSQKIWRRSHKPYSLLQPWSGQVKPDNPVKQLFLHFQFLPHIDLGSCTPSMSAVDDCYKTWKCTATHLAELRNEFDNGASGFAPVWGCRKSFPPQHYRNNRQCGSYYPQSRVFPEASGAPCWHIATRESCCTISPACGWRCQIAILNASQTSLAFILGLMLQPTTFLENKSMTTARYSQPSRVQM